LIEARRLFVVELGGSRSGAGGDGLRLTLRFRLRSLLWSGVVLLWLLIFQHFERWRAIGETSFDGLLIPIPKGEYPRLDTDQRVFLVTLFDERGEARSHRNLGAFAHVAQEVFLDRDVSDLLVM